MLDYHGSPPAAWHFPSRQRQTVGLLTGNVNQVRIGRSEARWPSTTGRWQQRQAATIHGLHSPASLHQQHDDDGHGQFNQDGVTDASQDVAVHWCWMLHHAVHPCGRHTCTQAVMQRASTDSHHTVSVVLAAAARSVHASSEPFVPTGSDFIKRSNATRCSLSSE